MRHTKLKMLCYTININKIMLYFPQEDEKFLTELFAQLTDGKSEEIRRKELVLFLKEFCTFAQALQPPGRESFFKTLNNLGILQVFMRSFKF